MKCFALNNTENLEFDFTLRMRKNTTQFMLKCRVRKIKTIIIGFFPFNNYSDV